MAAKQRKGLRPGTGRHGAERTDNAIACAVSASSMALKQRACGIAVSVRLSTSKMS